MDEVNVWMIYRKYKDGKWQLHGFTSNKDYKNQFVTTRKPEIYAVKKHKLTSGEFFEFSVKNVGCELLERTGVGLDKENNQFHYSIIITESEARIIEAQTRFVMNTLRWKQNYYQYPFQDEYRQALADLLYFIHMSYYRDQTETTEKLLDNVYIRNDWNIMLDVLGRDLI